MRRGFFMILWILLAVLFLGYGICIASVNSGTKFFLIWFILGVFCIFLAIAARQNWWSLLPKALKGIILTIVILCGVIFLMVEGCVVSGFSKKEEREYDYLLVLGAQVKESGPSVVLQYRLDQAVSYLEAHPETLCIVSGGQGDNEPVTEAEGMKSYLIRKGIAEERILKEEESLKTNQNIRNSMKLIPENASVGIVTNNFHMFRALKIAKKQGLADFGGMPAGSKPFYLPNNMLREFFGIVKDFLKGNL
ncbi:MAG: YdcF family protein [Lachnospiraceae bacterium]|nr:YdcF family protein [Lachnospiraceae bacterium]